MFSSAVRRPFQSAFATADAAAVFSPLSISGLKVWLKADAITGLVNLDPVGTWSDSSGNGYNVTQATAGKKPTYKTGIQNSLPAVSSDGGDALANAAVAFNIGTGDFYAAEVIIPRDVAIDQQSHFTVDNLSWQFGRRGAGLWYKGAVNRSFTGSVANGTPYLLEWLRESGTIKMFKNGVQDATTWADTVDFSGATAALTLYSRSSAALAELGTSDECEFLLYNALPSSGNRTLIRNYLNSKWAVY